MSIRSRLTSSRLADALRIAARQSTVAMKIAGPCRSALTRATPAGTTQRAVARVPLLLLLAACAPHRPNSLPATDAELVSDYPCPATIPSAWVAADSTLGHPPGCALVVAALGVVSDAAKSDTALARVAALDLVCVRARRVAYHGGEESTVGSRWTVEFYRVDVPRVLVTLVPAGGTSSAVLVPSPPGVSALALCMGG